MPVGKKTQAAHIVSPLAPKRSPKLPSIAGVLIGTAEAGVKYQNRTDLLLVHMQQGTQAAGVFTTSRTRSAPVDWCAANISAAADGRVLVVNSGNSNAFTGKVGEATVRATARAAAADAHCKPQNVYIASTGVIGQKLDANVVIAGMRAAQRNLERDAWADAARAIMTTDTYPKLSTRRTKIDGVPVTINGIAKGSGMIAPDLATMLVFIFTDAAIAAPALQSMLASAAEKSFNSITVDSDTSTSDTVLLFATGAAKHKPIKKLDAKRLAEFSEALEELMLDLAHQVVRDGEGASKFIEISVTGAEDARSARRIGFAIGNSPLVKTAIAGEDANWGRVVMAVGKSGERVDRDRLQIRIGGIDVAKKGMAVPGYDERPVAKHMKGQNILIEVDIGLGKGAARVWTCDLTYEYIRINADYRS
jgi:glutamate N-acetyltransferase/amino-acid N-acetyltransferase